MIVEEAAAEFLSSVVEFDRFRKRHAVVRLIRRALQKSTFVRQTEKTEKQLTKALFPIIKEQGESIVDRLDELGEKSVEDQAAAIVSQVFDPDDWLEKTIDATLPIMARNMAEAAVAFLLPIGIDLRRQVKAVGLKSFKAVATLEVADWIDDAWAKDVAHQYHVFGVGDSVDDFVGSHPALEALFDKETLTAAEEEVMLALTESKQLRQVIITKGDDVIAVVAWDEVSGKIEVKHLGSLKRGGGTRGISAPLKEAARSGKDLSFQSTQSATGFYDKLGFKKDPSREAGWYKTKPDELEKPAKKIVKKITGKNPPRTSGIPVVSTPDPSMTTASKWVQGNGDWDELVKLMKAEGLPLGVMTEIPPWMQLSITKQLNESFAQPYWAKIAETTGGDAEKFLRKGLAEGQSIRQMSKGLRQHYSEGGFRYARARAENIARTESGNALNGARDAALQGVKDEMGEAGQYLVKSWLSVLGDTTRATHADLDGVPADEEGKFNLAGYQIPWPAHYSLPPGERCNCMCTIQTEFGMKDEDAQAAIQEYNQRVEVR